MSVDYKGIADGDPGGDLTVAFEAMRAEVITSFRSLTSSDLRKWCVAFPDDYAGIKVASSTSVAAEIALLLIKSGEDHLSMEDPNVRAMVDGLRDSDVISSVGRDAIFAMATMTEAKYPGLRMGYIQDARRKRAGGLI